MVGLQYVHCNRNCLAVESDFEDATLTPHNVTLTSQKPCQNNNKFDCSETNGYNNPHDVINEVKFFFQ